MLEKLQPRMSQRIARAVVAFVYQRTKRAVGSADVVQTEQGLAVILTSPAEGVCGGAVKPGPESVDLQETYRGLLAGPSKWLQREITEITHSRVRAVSVTVDAATHAVVVFVTLWPEKSKT